MPYSAMCHQRSRSGQKRNTAPDNPSVCALQRSDPCQSMLLAWKDANIVAVPSLWCPTETILPAAPCALTEPPYPPRHAARRSSPPSLPARCQLLPTCCIRTSAGFASLSTTIISTLTRLTVLVGASRGCAAPSALGAQQQLPNSPPAVSHPRACLPLCNITCGGA